MLNNTPKWIATFFGIGLLSKAPGTAASLASLVLWVPLAHSVHWGVYALTWVAMGVVGLWASTFVMLRLPDKDA